MQELFRYIEMLPRDQQKSMQNIGIAGESNTFLDSVSAARNEEQPHQAMIEASSQFLEKREPLQQEMRRLDQFLSLWSAVAKQPKIKPGGLLHQINSIFKSSASEIVASDEFASEKQLISNLLVAVKLAPAQQKFSPEELTKIAQSIALIEKSAGTSAGGPGFSVKDILSATIAIPDRYLPMGLPAVAKPVVPPVENTETTRRKSLTERLALLETAYRFISNLEPEDIEVQPAIADESTREDKPDRGRGSVEPKDPSNPDARTIEARFNTRISASAFSRLPATVLPVFSALRIERETTGVQTIAERLRKEAAQVNNELQQIQRPIHSFVYRMGDQLFLLDAATDTAGETPPEPESPVVPQNTLQPMQVANLKKVKHTLVGYQPGEVSYIENIMKGEQFDREVNRREMSEMTTISDRESISFEQRDLQSTDRFELRAETDKLNENISDVETTDVSVEKIIGRSFTKSYGRLIERDNNYFVKDTIERAVNNLTDRVRQQRIQLARTEFAEKTSHRFDNKDGQSHKIGIYQWIDKEYRAEVVSYGQRLLFDLVLPEPAAFVAEQQKQSVQQLAGFELIRPTPPQYSAAYLTELNYQTEAHRYDVLDQVQPPPAPEFYIPIGMSLGWDSNTKLINHTQYVNIPAGYQAFKVWYEIHERHVPSGAGRLVLMVGSLQFERKFPIPEDSAYVIPSYFTFLSGESSNIPVTVFAQEHQIVSLHLMIRCLRTAQAFQEWQHRTFTVIDKGYRRQLAAYEEKLTTLQSIARAQGSPARSSARSRDIIRTELKKSFINTLTSQYSATLTGYGEPGGQNPANGPVDNPAQLTQFGSRVAFFERIFEWENLMYAFYPYYWSKKWDIKPLLQDNDPEFEAFLKAGAVRLVVPVRPGYEKILTHYLETGWLWMGEGQHNTIFSETYAGIMQEILQNEGPSSEEHPDESIEPWTVRVPTTLVMLKADDHLPKLE